MIRLIVFLLCAAGFGFFVMRSLRLKRHLPKLVLLDRDGVINVDRSDYVKSKGEFEFIPGSIEAIKLLNKARVKVIVVTNQGGIGKGLYTHEDLEDIHQHMKDGLKVGGAHVDQIFICADHPDSPSHRRKPNPGMIEEALDQTKTRPEEAHMIGDDMRDLLPALQCGVHRHLVLTGKGKKTLKDPELQSVSAFKVHANLLEAIKEILKV